MRPTDSYDARARFVPRRRAGAASFPRARVVLSVAFSVLLAIASPSAGAAPAQFSWMYGLQAQAGLEMAQSLGLNTLYLPTTNTGDSLRESQRLAASAHARGLRVIIALPALSQGTLLADPDDEAFREEVGARMRAVVNWLKDEPGVSAWAVADYPERELRYSPQAFIAFLQRRYPSLQALNASWGSTLSGWGQITLATPGAADSHLPYATGRASIDLADYHADTLRRLLDFWAEQVHGLDPVRPLFTGRLALYRSLASVPPAYDYVVPEAPVDVLEPDLLAGNVQAVDLARQGGAFEVVPSLRIPVPPEPYYNLGATLGRWIREAQLHGARGVALDGLQRLRSSAGPEEVLRSLREQLLPSAGNFTVRPRPSLCVLIEPYAGGRLAEQIPLYGYLSGTEPGEPNLLVSALRLGSKFGLVDYLTLEHLLEADLNQYSALLAPAAFRLPPEVQGRLRDYVQRGGRLVCDFGAGMYETGSWLALPADLATLCGIAQLSDLKDLKADLGFFSSSRFFPSLVPPMTSQGLSEPKPATSGSGVRTVTPADLKVWTFQGPMAMATPVEEAQPVGIANAWPGTPPPTARPDGPPGTPTPSAPPRFAGLIAHPFGLGWAAYCTGPLWARWDPGDPLFHLVHGDLWVPRAGYALKQSGLWPAMVEMCGGENAVWLFNPSRQALEATVQTRDSNHHLYQGAFMWLPAASGAAPRELRVTLPPDRVVELPRRPVQVLPVTVGVYAHLREYEANRVRLEVAGPGARVITGLRHERLLSSGDPCQALLVLAPGTYAIAPGSQHWVKINAGFMQRSETLVQADEQGKLRLQVAGAHVSVEIAPRPSIAASVAR